MALAPQERFALYLVGRERCIWCSRPISYSEMEVEHLIPKDLEGDELAQVLALHGLPPDYDLDALENFASSCRNCNGRKAARIPPDQPIIAIMLDGGLARARAIRDRAKVFIERRDVSAAVARIELYIEQSAHDPEVRMTLETLAGRLLEAQGKGGLPDERIEVADHPALALLWNPSGRWKVTRVGGPEVAVVSDGQTQGVVGTHISYQCSNCGSYGPWSGVICQTCGNREFPD